MLRTLRKTNGRQHGFAHMYYYVFVLGGSAQLDAFAEQSSGLNIKTREKMIPTSCKEQGTVITDHWTGIYLEKSAGAVLELNQWRPGHWRQAQCSRATRAVKFQLSRTSACLFCHRYHYKAWRGRRDGG